MTKFNEYICQINDCGKSAVETIAVVGRSGIIMVDVCEFHLEQQLRQSCRTKADLYGSPSITWH
ncbi:MAG: hypothetical protein GY853_13200 [PVC group bacterium]|nr:hypothetical protein [PVC group bacterium]